MRTHLCRVLLLVTAMLVMSPRAADAGLLSWLSRLSGPGPFWGLQVSVAAKCFGVDESTDPRESNFIGVVIPCRGAKLNDRHAAWYVIVGGAIAENNPLNYGDSGRQSRSTAVRQLKVGTALDYTAFPGLDVGVGAGLFYFAGPRFDNFARVYLEPARATIRPLVWGSSSDDRRERRGWLLISASWTLLLGEIDGSTFGAPLDPLNEDNESLLSLSASVDILRLFRSYKE